MGLNNVDADWAGNWLKTRPNDKTGALSCTGYIITYANCPIVWGSKMQSLVALSTTEAELIAMSTALREVIHLQNLLLELHGCNFPIPFTKLRWSAELSKTMLLALKWPNRTTRFVPGPSTSQFVSSIFVITWKRGLSLLSMSHKNINSPIFLPNHCPVINTSAYAIRSWGGRPHQLLNTRECEDIVGTTSNCLPTSVPVLPILLSAMLYSLQYLYSFLPIVCLFFLTQCLHP